jgi:hypothetical protein
VRVISYVLKKEYLYLATRHNFSRNRTNSLLEISYQLKALLVGVVFVKRSSI